MYSGYRTFFVRADTRRLLVALAAAWLSFGMVGLAVFLTAFRAERSYGLAGVAVAAFAVGSGLLAPFRGRLVDRSSVSLPFFACGYGGMLVVFAVLAERRTGAWPLVGCAAAAGASAPPLVASIRGCWTDVVEATLLRRAYAVTSVVGDAALVAAPALAGLLFVASPWLPLFVCAAAAIGSALLLAGRSRPPQQRGSLGAPVSGSLLAVSVALGAALGLVEVTVPTAATRWGETRWSGFVLGAFALGSILGGLWFGRREWRGRASTRYLVATLVLSAGMLPPLAARGPASLGLLLVATGLAYGPATVSLFESLDDLGAGRAAEALAWVTSAEAAGSAGGAASAGWIATRFGVHAPFAAGAIVLGATALAAIAPRVRRAALPRAGRGRRSGCLRRSAPSCSGCT